MLAWFLKVNSKKASIKIELFGLYSPGQQMWLIILQVGISQ